jgi:hypothetical protein
LAQYALSNGLPPGELGVLLYFASGRTGTNADILDAYRRGRDTPANPVPITYPVPNVEVTDHSGESWYQYIGPVPILSLSDDDKLYAEATNLSFDWKTVLGGTADEAKAMRQWAGYRMNTFDSQAYINQGGFLSKYYKG